MHINKIQLQIKIKRLNRSLSEKWYRLMKLLAKLINRIEKKKHDKFCKKSESMTIEEVAKRLNKMIIKELIRHSGDRRKYILELEVASRTIYDEDGMTLLEYMKRPHRDKTLRHWAYKIGESLEINKELSDSLIYSYPKQLNVKKIKNNIYEEYPWKKPKDYLYTIQISLY